MNANLPVDDAFMSEPPVLSSDAVEVLHALLASAEPQTPRALVSDEELGRFALGWITAEDEERILDALVASAELRSRLIRLDGEMSEDAAPGKWAFMAEAIRTSARAYMSSALAETQLGLAAAVRRGSEEAVAVLAAFRSLGEVISSESPVRWATTRSRIGETVEPDGSGGMLLTGRSTGGAYLREPYGGEVHILVSEEGRIPSLGLALGIVDEALPREAVFLTPRPTEHSENELRLRIQHDPSAWLPLAEMPAVRAGRFSICFRMTDEMKGRLAGKRIGISIRVGNGWITLIPPKAPNLAADRLVLVSPFEGMEDGEFQLLSVLRAKVE